MPLEKKSLQTALVNVTKTPFFTRDVFFMCRLSGN